MLIIEALGALQFLKKELITLSDLANILGLGRAAMSGRLQRKSMLKFEEIAKIEQYYSVNLVDFVEKMNNLANQPTKEELKELFNKMFDERIKELK